MNGGAPDGGAQAPDALAETTPAGKLRHEAPRSGGPRIDALVGAATRWLPAAGRLVEIGYDRGAILLRALVARDDARGIGIEIQPAAASLPLPPELAARVSLRTGDGLDALAQGEGDVLLIAGMGGRTIAEIVTRHPELTRSFAALVLSPSHLEADIRPALAALGLGLVEERLVAERGRFYEILVAGPPERCPLTASDADAVTAAWGPRLFDQRDPLLGPFLEDARRRFRAAFAQGLRAYASGPKAALGKKLATLDEALGRLR